MKVKIQTSRPKVKTQSAIPNGPSFHATAP
jgi:hypothetical protein